MNNDIFILQKSIRNLLLMFITGLVFSGLTAFPIEWQLSTATELFKTVKWDNLFTQWVSFIYQGIRETNQKFPFIAYGTDWLAFAHLVIAIAFIGPLRDPVRNVWVIEFGLIACVAVFPLAFIAGAIRDIPIYWRLIDCSFGIAGGLLLWIIYKKIKRLEIITTLIHPVTKA
jgi:hypothetical protein